MVGQFRPLLRPFEWFKEVWGFDGWLCLIVGREWRECMWNHVANASYSIWRKALTSKKLNYTRFRECECIFIHFFILLLYSWHILTLFCTLAESKKLLFVISGRANGDGGDEIQVGVPRWEEENEKERKRSWSRIQLLRRCRLSLCMRMCMSLYVLCLCECVSVWGEKSLQQFRMERVCLFGLVGLRAQARAHVLFSGTQS